MNTPKAQRKPDPQKIDTSPLSGAVCKHHKTLTASPEELSTAAGKTDKGDEECL